MITDRFPSLKGLILDMDGVLWKDEEPVIDLTTTFELINRLGLKVTLATNNATRSVEEYLKKLLRLGVRLEPWQIVTSAAVTGQYLQSHYPVDTRIYVVGTPSLKNCLREYGFSVTDDYRSVSLVVVGLDPQLTFDKLREASLAIRAGASFIATNPDPSFPTPEGEIPGAGAIISAIQTATGISPVVIGKPNPTMFNEALRRMELDAAQVLAVGDRLETDVLGAEHSGCRSGLVLSGVTTANQAAAWSAKIDVIAPDLYRMLHD